MLESGIDPATVRFEVAKCPYSKYSIFVLELVPLPPELSSSRTKMLYLQYDGVKIGNSKNARIGDRSGYRAFRSREMSGL